jgi:DNA polymerase III delta prime subunit
MTMTELPRLPQPLSHAYIITGGGQDSRREFAQRLTAAYLCENTPAPCGHCRHCEKVARGIHPDVFTLSPAEGKREIVAADARALRTDAYIRPNEAARKVYLIDPADALNPVAQNALLKVLEDGPAYAAFLLLTDQPGQLLETVRSRCETLSLPPEEEQTDPELDRKGRELARLLLSGSEWELAPALTALELEKPKNAQLMDLLAAAETAVSEQLGKDRRAVAVLRCLKQCRDNAVFNPGVGHTLGWLCAELYR